jgi:hypothetical protein
MNNMKTARVWLLGYSLFLWTSLSDAQVPGPVSWSLTTYRDTFTGVSFQYPSALRPVKDVNGYVSPALTQTKGSITFHVKLALHLRQSLPERR